MSETLNCPWCGHRNARIERCLEDDPGEDDFDCEECKRQFHAGIEINFYATRIHDEESEAADADE